MKLFGTSCFLSLLFLMGRAQGSVVVYSATHYLQRSESPFYGGIQAGGIFLQDFENNLSTPNLAITNAVLSGLIRYSVDDDDGSITSTPVGRSLMRDPVLPFTDPITFNFTTDAHGHYPRFFGVVILTPSIVSNPFDIAGEFLGVRLFNADLSYQKYFVQTPDVQPLLLSNDVYYATFIGVYADEGITQITLDATQRFDHLQYGYSIPEASSLLTLAASGLARLAFRRRRPRIH